MKLEVPFYKQTTDLNCGPAALKMVFSYFGKDLDLDNIETAVGIKAGKAVSTLRLAIAVTELGFKSILISKSLYLDEANLALDMYKKHASVTSVEQSQQQVQEAQDKGVELHERTMPLEELLSLVTPERIPIVLLNWRIVTGEKGYFGHFVPIVRYDNNAVFVHNHGLRGTQAFYPIEQELFDCARKAKGTDEDILIIKKAGTDE